MSDLSHHLLEAPERLDSRDSRDLCTISSSRVRTISSLLFMLNRFCLVELSPLVTCTVVGIFWQRTSKENWTHLWLICHSCWFGVPETDLLSLPDVNEVTTEVTSDDWLLIVFWFSRLMRGVIQRKAFEFETRCPTCTWGCRAEQQKTLRQKWNEIRGVNLRHWRIQLLVLWSLFRGKYSLQPQKIIQIRFTEGICWNNSEIWVSMASKTNVELSSLLRCGKNQTNLFWQHFEIDSACQNGLHGPERDFRNQHCPRTSGFFDQEISVSWSWNGRSMLGMQNLQSRTSVCAWQKECFVHCKFLSVFQVNSRYLRFYLVPEVLLPVEQVIEIDRFVLSCHQPRNGTAARLKYLEEMRKKEAERKEPALLLPLLHQP